MTSSEAERDCDTTNYISNAQTEKAGSNVELTIKDITDEGGYDGDIEGQLPYELEEPDTDSELDIGSAPVTETTLAKDFCALRCQTPDIESLDLVSNTSQARKRPLDEIMSDNEHDSDVNRPSTPPAKRQRKPVRRRCYRTAQARNDSEEPMDIDISPSPTSAAG